MVLHATSSRRHLAASLIDACVVSGEHPRPIRGTGSSCLPVVWHGPYLVSPLTLDTCRLGIGV